MQVQGETMRQRIERKREKERLHCKRIKKKARRTVQSLQMSSASQERIIFFISPLSLLSFSTLSYSLTRRIFYSTHQEVTRGNLITPKEKREKRKFK